MSKNNNEASNKSPLEDLGVIGGVMKAAYLPGNSTVEFREVDIPEPGHGQVLIKTKSSTICGSDIRAIYREHLGKGPEAYQNKIAGHEPCGQIVKCGPGMKRFKEGDRVVLYHISKDDKLLSMEVISFNEPLEYLPSKNWSDQFNNTKTVHMLYVSKNIPTISGATLSANAITDGSRIAFAIYNELLKNR